MGRVRLIGLLVGAVVLGALLVPGSALADTYGLPTDFLNPAWSFYAGSPAPGPTRLSNCSGTSCDDGSSGDSVSAGSTTFTMTAGTSGAVTVVWTDSYPSSVPVSVTNGMTVSTGAGCPLGGALSVSDQQGALSSGTLPPGDQVYITLTSKLPPVSCSASGTITIAATPPAGGGGGGGGGGGSGNSTGLAVASLGAAPLHIAAPTISGTTKDSSDSIAVLVYAGGSATGTPARRLSAGMAGGRFAVQILPALDDGQYTAVATQAVGSGVATSAPVIFRIKVYGPALTLSQPGRHAKVHRKMLRFSGAAGTALGDAPAVTIVLYRGKSDFGRRVGKTTVMAHGSSWSSGWPKRLPVGFYTAVAAQHDDASHTTHTSPRTFHLIK